MPTGKPGQFIFLCPAGRSTIWPGGPVMSTIWQSLRSMLGAGSVPSAAKRRRARPYTIAYESTSRYRACTIEPGPGACAAVTRLQDQRILQADAPMLPLPDCGRLQCDCRYRRHEDRRQPDADRRALGAITPHTYLLGSKERRFAFGRRVDDDCTTDEIMFR